MCCNSYTNIQFGLTKKEEIIEIMRINHFKGPPEMDTSEGLQSRQMHMDDLNKIIMLFQKNSQRLAHYLLFLQSSNVNLRLQMHNQEVKEFQKIVQDNFIYFIASVSELCLLCLPLFPNASNKQYQYEQQLMVCYNRNIQFTCMLYRN